MPGATSVDSVLAAFSPEQVKDDEGVMHMRMFSPDRGDMESNDIFSRTLHKGGMEIRMFSLEPETGEDIKMRMFPQHRRQGRHGNKDGFFFDTIHRPATLI